MPNDWAQQLQEIWASEISCSKMAGRSLLTLMKNAGCLGLEEYQQGKQRVMLEIGSQRIEKMVRCPGFAAGT